MELFLSWSKPQSHHVALLLHSWIPDIIQQVRPWMSSENIDKGQRWALEVGSRLDIGSQGIICITRENFSEPWLNFEAGALAKSLSEGRVRPVLFDLRPAEVKGPLSQFQATVASNKADMHKLIRSLNEQCADPLDEARLAKAFEKGWKDFEQGLTRVPPAALDIETPPIRSVDDMMREILERVRDMQRSITPRSAGSAPGRWGLNDRVYARDLRESFARLEWDFTPTRGDEGIDGVLIFPPSTRVNVIISFQASAVQLRRHIRDHAEMLRIDPSTRTVIISRRLTIDPDGLGLGLPLDSFAVVQWRSSSDDVMLRDAVVALVASTGTGAPEEPKET